MGVYGADVAQLRDTATEFDRAAEQLASISTLLGSELARAPWKGADAVSFRSNWDTDYSRRIAEGSTRLREAARTLRSNADDQETTSAVTGGPGGGGGGTGGGGGFGGSGGDFGGTSGGGGGGGGGGPVEGDGPGWSGAEGEAGPTGVSGKAGIGATFEDKWDLAGAEVTREGDYGLGAKGEAGWKFNFDGDEGKTFDGKQWGDDTEKAGGAGLTLGAEASGKAGAWAEDSLEIGWGGASAGVGYDAMAGARAEAGAGIEVGPDGVQAAAKLGGFAGAEIKGNVQGEVFGLGGGVEAGVRAGIGGELSATADLGLDKVKLEFEIGASLGVGFSIKPNIEFSPKEMADDVMDLFGW
ncbi:hypothetical protein ASD65_11780 [Microbacterium sp. Root61]|uniref:hypothetical protein n=1 Tax=Microbacterium sp. Root61 TaxID=1736570 RepID=UPI0006F4ED05|nr:hypothetical protein [Microbacterium sp. Root61]KRA25028.1 hypothetical protein ASD65_11780 [Microbacterium sp. Root61]